MMVSVDPFNRSGLAALSDLETPEWDELFAILEKEQSSFLAQEYEFRSPEYKWPRDPLHNWSRCWEYPYVYHHLRKWRSGLTGGTSPHLVDVGSGVTFFPFAVARLGCNVSCTDIDSICEKDLSRAALKVSQAPGFVNFRLTNGSTLPFSDGEMDAVYCISVIEHLPDFDILLKEIHRILKSGGIFLLTFDLDLRGDQEIGPLKYRQLKDTIKELFSTREHEVTIHPVDLLTSCNGPYPEPGQPFRLAVEGQILTRKT
jgi:SAM-dependent methyltransferase